MGSVGCLANARVLQGRKKMNEEFKRLKQQAFIMTELEDLDYDVILERFGQLVVKECLNQCYYRGMNDELYAGQLRAAEYIENYFGVRSE